jgi:hypothetical protein
VRGLHTEHHQPRPQLQAGAVRAGIGQQRTGITKLSLMLVHPATCRTLNPSALSPEDIGLILG